MVSFLCGCTKPRKDSLDEEGIPVIDEDVIDDVINSDYSEIGEIPMNSTVLELIGVSSFSFFKIILQFHIS